MEDHSAAQEPTPIGLTGFLEMLAARGPGHRCIGLCQASDEALEALARHAGSVKDSATFGVQVVGKLLSAAAYSGALDEKELNAAGELVRMLGELSEAGGDFAGDARYLLDHPAEKARMRAWIATKPAM